MEKIVITIIILFIAYVTYGMLRRGPLGEDGAITLAILIILFWILDLTKKRD